MSVLERQEPSTLALDNVIFLGRCYMRLTGNSPKLTTDGGESDRSRGGPLSLRSLILCDNLTLRYVFASMIVIGCAWGSRSGWQCPITSKHLSRRPRQRYPQQPGASLNGFYVLDIRCDYQLVHMGGSDLRTARTLGITRMVAVWRWGKAKVNRLSNTVSRARATHESTSPLPYEIVEMIVAHIIHDLPTLKACSLTCRSWYIVVFTHIHHTIILGRGVGGRLKSLSELRELGLIPLVKEIRVRQGSDGQWFTPQAFRHRDFRHFLAFANVHTLRLQGLEIYRFIPRIERYFEHLLPTLRSITLSGAHGTPRQLSHFLSYFSNLDDIEIQRLFTVVPNATDPDRKHAPFSAPQLRGQLTLYDFPWDETWVQLIESCGGLRFRYMHLRDVAGCTPVLLDACAETLEMLRFNATDDWTIRKQSSLSPSTDSN